MYIDDRAYLTPLNNEAIPVLKCSFCEEDIYVGDEFYKLDGINCCEECLDMHFKSIAELPDYEAIKAEMER